MVEILRDWGVGLDLHLYEDALTHFLDGKERVMTEIDIVLDDRTVGRQKIRLSSPSTAFKITALGDEGDAPIRRPCVTVSTTHAFGVHSLG